jgi:hypothetical protein
MVVSDQQVAALRAMLTGDAEENKRLVSQFDRGAEGAGYSALVNAGFFEAVDRRFGKDSTPAGIIEYVADVRSRSDAIAAKLDPAVAERLIRSVISDETTDDVDSKTSARGKLFLLTAIVADEQFSPAELDQFLARVRKMADYLLRD